MERTLAITPKGAALRGRREAGVVRFPGIRYAERADGRRFGLPIPASGQLDVERLAEVPVFPQLPSRLAAAMGRGGDLNPQDEDAFFLNVWARDGAERLPVIVFLHGGAWTTGGGSLPWYDGGRLASEGAVVVTVNYRIGALGHIVAGEGGLDLPFEDLLCALRWVQDNIGSLGGDPDRVTIMGQSAGAWYGHALSVSPVARGLLHRAAHLSMATRTPWSPGRREVVAGDVAQRLGGDPASAPIASLLAAGAAAVAAAHRPLGFAPSAWLPTAGPGLPADLLDPAWCAEHVHAEAVLFRYTAQETGMFFHASESELTATMAEVDRALANWDPADMPAQLDGLEPYDRLVAASSWAQFQRLPTELAAAYSDAGVPTQLECFSFASPMRGIGSGHCFDLPFQFGSREAFADAPMLAGIGPEEFEDVSQSLRRQLADLATAD